MYKPSRTVFLLAILCAAVLLHAGTPQANVPDWVKSLAAQPVGTYPPRTNAVVLLEETTLSINSENEYIESGRRVVRILRPDGRDEGVWGVPYGIDDKVLSVHAWSIDATGREYEVKEKEFVDVGAWGDELYSDDRARTTRLPAAEAGSVVAFEYSVRRKPWIPQDTWVLQEDIPVKESRYTLEVPPGWVYKAAWTNASPQEPVQLAPNKWQWTRRDLAGIKWEPMRPSIRALAARVSISFSKPGTSMHVADTWESIGRWDFSLTNGRRNLTPEITEKVRQLTAGASTFDAKIKAIANFIQNEMRYVAVEIGIGGVQPHFAADVFKHRYGDCKDMSTLMGAMLEAAGIRSYYVSVDTGHGVIDPKMPYPFFNHSIIAIELPADAPKYRSVVTTKNGKKYLIFDATNHFIPIGDIGGYIQGNAAMIATEQGGEIITLPLLEPEQNHLKRTGKFVLAADGTLSGEVEELRSGDNAWGPRSKMLHLNETERQQYIERFLGNSLNGSLKDNTIENLKDLDKDLILRYKLSSSKYAQSVGPLLLIRARVLGQKGVDIDWKDRKFGVELDAPSFETDTYEITLPEGFVIDDVPEPVQIDVGFATYKGKIETSGSTIRYHREYIVKDPNVPFEKLADLKRLQQVIGVDENASVVLKKK